MRMIYVEALLGDCGKPHKFYKVPNCRFRGVSMAQLSRNSFSRTHAPVDSYSGGDPGEDQQLSVNCQTDQRQAGKR
eukprot:7467887-Pyramimonas_sp.AAC.1